MPTLPTTTKGTTRRTTTTEATTTEATTTTTEREERSTMSSEQIKKHREVCNVLMKVAKAANISINSTVLQNCNKSFDATTSNSTENPGGVQTTTTPKTKPTTLKTTTTPEPKTRPPLWGPFQYKNLVLGTRYSYEHALHLSSMFFEAQKSGRLPRDNRIGWRGNSALRDKAEGGQSLVGECFELKSVCFV